MVIHLLTWYKLHPGWGAQASAHFHDCPITTPQHTHAQKYPGNRMLTELRLQLLLGTSLWIMCVLIRNSINKDLKRFRSIPSSSPPLFQWEWRMTVVILITKKPSACKGDCSFVPSAPGAPGSPQTSWSNTEIWLLSYLSVLSLPPTISTLHLCNWWKIPCSTLVHFKPKSWTSIYYTLKYVRCQEGIEHKSSVVPWVEKWEIFFFFCIFFNKLYFLELFFSL